MQLGNHGVQFTVAEILAVVLAFLGAVGTTSMLIMNLKVTTAVQMQKAETTQQFSRIELQIERARSESNQEHSAVKLQLAELRTKIAEESNARLERMMRDVQNTYTDRRVSEQMHASNTQRFDEIIARMEKIEEKINL